ncbi:MAG TPA: imidazolonepropionase [Coleofasciculaceae cyanobacterium]|jgi:imidazolonepropionase
MTATLIHNIGQLITIDSAQIIDNNPLGIIENGALVIEDGRIAWIGSTADINPADFAETIDARGRVVMPGLIDSHTHTIFAGDRADEFEMRLQGKTYLEIAHAGGGILKTVDATRKASEQELYDLTRERLLRMLSLGVTTVEVKSGYGLDFATELKCLNVLRNLQTDSPVSIVPTYMGAHDIPPEYHARTDDYVELICNAQIPAIAQQGLAVFCDVFCEQGYFDVAQTRRILEAASAHGLKLKVHAEEFVNLGGAELAGEMGATSADHLLNISDAGIAALKAGGTVATLLPGTAFFLRLKEYAPVQRLLSAGVPVALGTDFNPGSCLIDDLQLIMQLACLQMNMQPVDVIRAVTLNAAKALDLQADRGSLAVGKRADMMILNASSYNALFYNVGRNLVSDVFVGGRRYLRRWFEEHLAPA